MTRLNQKVARKIEEEKARLEKVLADLQRKFREGWWGDYRIKFRAGDPYHVFREDSVDTDNL